MVAWARLVKPDVYYYSEYLQLDAVYAQRLGAGGGGPITVSQNADTYEATPSPGVAINDSGTFVVGWTYAPPNSVPASQLTAAPGVYARRYDMTGPTGNEFMVVSSPNTAGQPSYPSPIQYVVGHDYHPVGIDTAGNFAVGWGNTSYDSSRSTNSRLRVQAYMPDGTARGDAFSVAESSYAFGPDVGPNHFRFAMDANGDLTTAWGNPDPVANTGATVLGRRFVRADFDVQRGQTQRDTVQYVDVTFNLDAVAVVWLLNAGRLRLTRYDLTGTGSGTDVPLDGVKSVSGGTLTLDFGSVGLPNGYYVLEADLGGDGAFEGAWRFYRMAVDYTGTGLNNYPGLMPGLILND